MNARVKTLWNASDADAAGSGAQLEGEVERQFAAAVEGGQLDPQDRTAVTGFLAGLGVTDQKGGGRFLFRKLMGMHGGPSIGARYAGRAPQMGMETPGSSMHSAGRNALMAQYGISNAPFATAWGSSTTSFGQPPAMKWPFGTWGTYGMG